MRPVAHLPMPLSDCDLVFVKRDRHLPATSERGYLKEGQIPRLVCRCRHLVCSTVDGNLLLYELEWKYEADSVGIAVLEVLGEIASISRHPFDVAFSNDDPAPLRNKGEWQGILGVCEQVKGHLLCSFEKLL